MTDRHVYDISLRTRFRGLDRRDGMLLRGPAGWAEFSPFWDYADAESANWLRAAHEAAFLGWPEPRRDRIPVNVTVPVVDADRATAIVAASGGCQTAKIKVAEPGEDPARERDRVAAVREALGPHGHIRVDANGNWDVETALTRLADLNRVAGGLQYVEQPCRTVDELAEVRRRGAVPVAADESIRRASDPAAVVKAEAADVMVVKVQPLGGVRAALALIDELGLPVVVSSALETGVGIRAGLALAAALPSLDFACGLATTQLMDLDVLTEPLTVSDGELPVSAIDVSARELYAATADLETETRWFARYESVAKLLNADLQEDLL